MGPRVESGAPSTFRLQGELDLFTVHDAEAALFAGPSGGVVVLDLSELRFMDSTGIHLILRLLRSSSGVRLVAPNAMVRKVLAVSGLDHIDGVAITNDVGRG